MTYTLIVSRLALWRTPPVLTGLAVVYVLILVPIYHSVGGIASALVILPVAVAGWLLRPWGGLFAGVSGILLNKLIQYGVGSPEWANVADRWPGFLAVIGIGVAGGWGRALYDQVKAQAHDLERQRKMLVAQIAERERAEQALIEEKQRLQVLFKAIHEKENQYRGLVESINDAFFTLDMKGQITYISPVIERLFQYTVQDWFGQPFTRFVHPQDLPGLCASLPQMLAGHLEPYTFRIHDKDGTVCHVRMSSSPRMEAGQPVGLTGLLTDITRLKRMEDTLQMTQTRLQRLVAANPAVLYSLQIEPGNGLTPEWISDNLERLVGYTAEEADYAAWWLEHVHPEDREQALDHTATLLERGHIVHEYRFRHKDGSYRWIHDELRAIYSEDETLTEVVGAWVDISERKQLEAQFLQAQKLETVGLLAGGVAHDFNNLLTVILGYAAIMTMEHNLSNQARNGLEEIKQAGERAATLTRHLMAFSRKQTMNPRTVNLNTVISGIERMIHRLIEERIDFRFKPDPALGLVKVDPGQFEQVLMNLVVNARDAMPEGGLLTIETANIEIDTLSSHASSDVPAGAYVRLTVGDSGHGMDANTKARIFEPFFTTKEPGKGTGLGLSAVYGIVYQSNGVIQVDSAPGQGTTFRIYLPCVGGAVSFSGPSAEAEEFPRGTETVLLAEDENEVRTLVSRLLRLQGYTVLEAVDGQEALRLIQQQPVHLLITDIVMPHMDGPELKDRLLNIYPDMRVLYISGYSMRGGNIVIPSDDETPLLRKPFSIRTLAHAVREALDTGLVNA